VRYATQGKPAASAIPQVQVRQEASADAIKFGTWDAVDAQQATPGTPLARDLAALTAAQQAASSPAGAVYNASVRVLNDCTTLGVTFQP
jgi:hypothetical protein